MNYLTTQTIDDLLKIYLLQRKRENEFLNLKPATPNNLLGLPKQIGSPFLKQKVKQKSNKIDLRSELCLTS